VDIAGLVKGASQGEGLGNKFSHPHPRSGRHRAGGALLRGCDIHHVAGAIDPVRDIETSRDRVGAADLETVTNASSAWPRTRKRGDKVALAEEAVLQKLEPAFESGQSGPHARAHAEERQCREGFYPAHDKPTISRPNVKEATWPGR
jgi:ribosome-binding ATPase YchF (GTP1/OBG family)